MSLDSVLGLVQTALELGLISSLTVLALFLSYSMLGVCDLSTDGCFTLGATVGAAVAIAGHPYLSIPAAMLCGMLSGFVTAVLQTKMGVNSLLSGIIVNTALYSVNIAVMGGSSVLNMNKTQSVFSDMKDLLAGSALSGEYKLVVSAIAVVLVCVFLGFFLKTRLGLAIRATGNNPDMVRSSSINPSFTTIIGLCVANAFTALSGCLLAQSQKSVNIDIGSGMVTIALASLLIGHVFLGRKKLPLRIFGMVLGAFLFRLVYTIALRFDMPAFMLKFVSAVVVVAAISIPYLKDQLPMLRRRAGAQSRKEGVSMLKLTNISKTFNPGTEDAKLALDNVSLHVRPGDFISIIGANGAGKSTLFGAIAGSFITDSGEITLDGADITLTPEHKRSKQIGRLFQDPMRGSAPGMTIEENLALGSRERAAGSIGLSKQEKKQLRERVALLGMGLEDRMSQPVGLLSGGQRQALTLMMATYNPPKLLLLDEHTAALDPGTAEKVLALTTKIVEENKLTCLMITHNMASALDLGNRTIMMNAGKIVLDVEGAERDALTVSDLLARFREISGKALDNDRMLLI